MSILQKIPQLVQPMPFVAPPIAPAPQPIPKGLTGEKPSGGIIGSILDLFGGGGKGGKGGGGDVMSLLAMLGI